MAKAFHYDPEKKNILYPILIPVGRFLVHFVFKAKIIGLENVPKKGGFILASNHLNALDPVFVASFCPRTLHFMAKTELFEKGFGRWFVTNMNGFPVNREGMDTKAISYAEQLLQKGHALGIFPEGTRSKTRTPGRAKAGVAMIAKVTKVDVVPVSIYFSEKPHFRSRLTIRFGEPIPYASLGLTDPERNTQQLRDAAKLIMERITALWEKKHEA